LYAMKLGRRGLLKASAAAMLGSLMPKDLNAQPGEGSGVRSAFYAKFPECDPENQ